MHCFLPSGAIITKAFRSPCRCPLSQTVGPLLMNLGLIILSNAVIDIMPIAKADIALLENRFPEGGLAKH